MAIVAKVELTGCLTHSARGRTFKKGQPQIITDPSDVAYYQAQSGFCVSILDKSKDVKPVAAATPVEKPEEPKAEPKTEVAPARRRYAESELKAMNKTQLLEIALGYGLAADENVKKADLVADIIEAQS